MARNNNKMTRRKKVEPAALTMTFSLPQIAAGSAARMYIDLSQCASLLNRRFYRQGINWAVSKIKVLSDYNGFVFTNKLPTTWVMSNAWEKGFRSWQKMNNEALQEAESVKPKFLDFKIYANANHHNDGFGANLLPLSYDNAVGLPYATVQALPGEWTASKFRIPDSSSGLNATQNREIVAVGDSYTNASAATGFNAVSLIDGYAASRALPDIADPNTPDDAASADGSTPVNWMSALFNEGTQQTDDVLDDMITENTVAPYPFENDGVNLDTMYPGGANQLGGLQIHDTSLFTGTTVGGETHIPGGMFPCGLIELLIGINADTVNTGGTLQIELVPGDHRGYLCEPMTEM